MEKPNFDRRAFLKGAGKLALGAGAAAQLAWLAACSPKPEASSTVGARPGSGSAFPWPDDQASVSAWDQLAKNLHGTLLRPGDTRYLKTIQVRNTVFQDVLPAGVAVVADIADVQTALKWAQDNGVEMTTRSGGHSFGGYSTTRGLVINLSGMTDSMIDQAANTITVKGAATNLTVTEAGQPVGVAVAGGQCPTVGIPGLTLGGGLGFYMRRHGLTLDALQETEIVTADGTVLTCNANENVDLFWALRGGGGGNFGINTSFTFTPFEVPDLVSVYSLVFNTDDIPAAFAAYQDLLPDAPGELSGVARFFPATPESGDAGTQLKIFGQFLGGSKQKLLKVLAPLLDAAQPATHEVDEMTFWEAKKWLGESVGAPNAFAERSRFIPNAFSEEGVLLMIDGIQSFPGVAPADSAISSFFAWGGAVADVAADATAFAHRSDRWLMMIDASWSLDDPAEQVQTIKAWQNDLWGNVGPMASDRSYVNFIDPELTDPMSFYYGEALPRLVDIKKTYDPHDVFAFPQGIPTSL